MRKILLFEVNEVPLSLLAAFADQGDYPHLQQLWRQGRVFESLTTDEGHLHPWSTWPTLHRGVNNTVHHIKDFGQDLSELDKSYPPVWQLAQAAGTSVGICGSIHTHPVPDNFRDYAFYLPDPFAADTEAQPAYLEKFQAFNLAMSRRSVRNVDGGIAREGLMSLLMNMPRMGVRSETVAQLVTQLKNERGRPELRTRRRSFQGILAFDIFLKQWRRHQPELVTFFTNHLAATMHRYWAATFPDQFDPPPPADWIRTYKDEIPFAVKALDRMLKPTLKWLGQHPDYVMVFASSMGQAATKVIPVASEVEMKLPKTFLAALGLDTDLWTVVPSMHPQYNLRTADSSQAAAMHQQLDQVLIDQKPIKYREQEDGFFAIDLGHNNVKQEVVTYAGKEYPFAELGLANKRVDEALAGTAYHIAEGSLIVYDPQQPAPQDQVKQVDTRAVAPTVLEALGLTVPDYMSGERIPDFPA